MDEFAGQGLPKALESADGTVDADSLVASFFRSAALWRALACLESYEHRGGSFDPDYTYNQFVCNACNMWGDPAVRLTLEALGCNRLVGVRRLAASPTDASDAAMESARSDLSRLLLRSSTATLEPAAARRLLTNLEREANAALLDARALLTRGNAPTLWWGVWLAPGAEIRWLEHYAASSNPVVVLTDLSVQACVSATRGV